MGNSCKFNCPVGPDIDSVCSQDGTWIPYPTCQGDIRDTQDGCDGCPGGFGGKRNRTAEAILGIGPKPKKPAGFATGNDRKVRPSFAGNRKFGQVDKDGMCFQAVLWVYYYEAKNHIYYIKSFWKKYTLFGKQNVYFSSWGLYFSTSSLHIL